MAMEDALFIRDFTIEIPISSGFPIATFDYRRVIYWGGGYSKETMFSLIWAISILLLLSKMTEELWPWLFMWRFGV